MAHKPHVREVRLGLVFNGGVSLAVWMGGVTQEIDSARRADASASDESARLWHELQSTILRQSVRVDIIGGASAGGINGAMLATAIATDQPLAKLRDVWMQEGSLERLLRDPSGRNLPSLLQGDKVLLKSIKETIAGQMSAPTRRPTPHPLYLYITATDFYGRPYVYRDATGQGSRELDPRHVFSFESIPPSFAATSPSAGEARRGPPPEWPERGAGPTSFDHPDLVRRLARAARASSSFPAAFEAAGPYGPARDPYHFIDGGVLDNQPFGPVLDRLSVMPAEGALVKRVVGYIVPYGTDPVLTPHATFEETRKRRTRPTALETIASSFTLPRDLPKLQSLDRVTAQQEAERSDEAQRELIQRGLRGPGLAGDLEVAAEALFSTYRETRLLAASETFRRWSEPSFVPGAGRLGQDPTIAIAEIAPPVPPSSTDLALPRPWIPDDRLWPGDDDVWRWGLSPAERVATWALLAIRDALAARGPLAGLVEARRAASRLVWDIRTLTRHLSESVAWPANPEASPAYRAERAYEELRSPVSVDLAALRWLQDEFVALDKLVAGLPEAAGVPRVQVLLNFEIARNALAISSEGPPFPFQFIFMSAAVRNSLGHDSRTPDDKLAGMKLGHFGGFVKDSWRANDWLWGRLDGVEHILRATFDREHLVQLTNSGDTDLASKLAEFAFGDAPETSELGRRWTARARSLSPPLRGSTTARRFREALKRAIDGDRGALELCRVALAARIQLAILGEGLDDVANAARADEARGFSPDAPGAIWMREYAVREDAGPAALVASFRAMRIGGEPIAGELRSPAGSDLFSQAWAVAKEMLVGDRGGISARMRLLPRALLGWPIGTVAKLFARRELRKDKQAS
jgi:predicted acylesterase/phospholipase RssA